VEENKICSSPREIQTDPAMVNAAAKKYGVEVKP